MLELLKSNINTINLNKRGNAGWVIVALIIAAAIVISVYLYTSSQTHPFWEVR